MYPLKAVVDKNESKKWTWNKQIVTQDQTYGVMWSTRHIVIFQSYNVLPQYTHTHRTIITQNTSYGHGKMVSAIYIMYHFWDHSSVLKMQSNGMTLRQMWTASRPQPKSADDPCCWSHEDPVRPNTTENEHIWSKTLVFKCHFHISICILTY